MMSNKPQFVGEKVRLGDICTIVSGATPKTKTDEYWGGIIKWITPAELSDDSHYVSDTEKHLTDAGFKNASLHMMPKGTVLLTTRAPIGKIAIATEEMCCNQGFKNLICSEAINNEFLFRYLKSQTTRLQAMGHGATFKELSKKDVAEFKINLPTLDRPSLRRLISLPPLRASWHTRGTNSTSSTPSSNPGLSRCLGIALCMFH